MSTWIFFRGLMRESRHWGEFPALFQHAMAEQPVVLLDFPGNGCLHMQTSARNIEEMVNFARSQLQQLGHAPPYRLLAISLGAMVAVAWSRIYPEELEKMVLINTSLAPCNPFYHRLRPQNYLPLLRLLYGTAAQRESLILRLTSTRSRTEVLQATLGNWVAYAKEYPISRANILRQLKAALAYRASPNKPPVPVLLLAAEQDRLVNVKSSIALAQHWGCAIKLHSTAGHDLPLDDCAWVIQQIKEWTQADY